MGRSDLRLRTQFQKLWEWDFFNGKNMRCNKKQKVSEVSKIKTPSTHLCHTYSEPPGHKDSPGTI